MRGQRRVDGGQVAVCISTSRSTLGKPAPATDRFGHHIGVVKQPLTVELEEDVILATRAEARQTGQSEAAVVEQALRDHLSVGSSVTDQVWSRIQAGEVSAGDALALAYDELDAMRREREDHGKAVSQQEQPKLHQ